MSEHEPRRASRKPAIRHQRVNGAARLSFCAGEDGRTQLADLYQRAPCRLLFPDIDQDELPQAVVLNTSGGMTAGDRFSLAIAVEEGAAATLTTQAAEKYYRAAAAEEEILVDTAVRVAAGGWCEWLAQEAILFDGARLKRRLEADVASDARFLAVEGLVLGRIAMGEQFNRGKAQDIWRIRRDGRLIWADGMYLGGDIADLRRRPFGFGEATAAATLLYVGADAGAHLPAVRALLAESPGIGAATSFNGLLITRFLAADAQRLRSGLMRVAAGLRHACGFSRRLPQVWNC